MFQDTGGAVGINIGVRRKISGSWTWKQIVFKVDANGTVSFTVPDQAAARSALGLTGISVRPDYDIKSSSNDLTPGTSTLASGKLYFVYS